MSEMSVNFKKVLGYQIRQARKYRGYGLREFAERLKMDPSQLSRYELGKLGMSLKTFSRVAAALNMTARVHLVPLSSEHPAPL